MRIARQPLPVVLRRWGGHLALLLGMFVLLAPFVITVLISIRPAEDVAADPLGFPTRLTLDNLVLAWNRLDYGRAVTNTIIYVVCSSVLVVLLGAMASYPIARITQRWTNAAYRYFIVGTTIPIFVLLAPLYLLLRDLGLLNTRPGVILIYTAMNLPVAVFFFSSFLRSVPVELEEAASIDGAGPYRTFFQIVFPLVRPVTATVVTFLVLGLWNDLIVPLIFVQGQENRTIMANAFALIDPRKVDPTTLFPAALLGVAPLVIVYAFLQRYLVAGIVGGALK